jgi:hypothetical protein
VNVLPIPERPVEPPLVPVNPPAWAEVPERLKAFPRAEIPYSLPQAAYFPRAVQQDELFSIWNQPVSFQMPAKVAPRSRDTDFDRLRYLQFESSVQGT